MQYEYIGVDLAVEKPDVCARGKYYHFPNNGEGQAQLLELAGQIGAKALVAYESTGYVSSRFARMLIKEGINHKCINPAWVHYFAKSKGMSAKTDKKDSRVIYEYARSSGVLPDKLYNEFIIELRAKVSARGLPVRQRADLKTACSAYQGQNQAHMEAMIKAYDGQIKELEKEIKGHIMQSPQHEGLYGMLCSQPGIGVVMAMTLTAYLPEPGKVNGRKIAAMAGLAPYNHDSGAMAGKRCISGGRAQIRNTMYVAETACLGMKKWDLREYYGKLKKTKPHRVVMTACCRRHLVRLNAKVRDRYKNGCNVTLPQEGYGEAAQASPSPGHSRREGSKGESEKLSAWSSGMGR